MDRAGEQRDADVRCLSVPRLQQIYRHTKDHLRSTCWVQTPLENKKGKHCCFFQKRMYIVLQCVKWTLSLFYIWKHCWLIERNTFKRAIDFHQRFFSTICSWDEIYHCIFSINSSRFISMCLQLSKGYI